MVSCRTVCDDRVFLSLPGLSAPVPSQEGFLEGFSSTHIPECLILGDGGVLSLRDENVGAFYWIIPPFEIVLIR